MDPIEIKIRFNTHHLKDKSLPKWRVLAGETEYQVNDVIVHCPCMTTTDIVMADGIMQEKHHITVKASSFIVTENTINIR